ncbi:amidohydrolase family protein [Novosphingobium sp. AP12]|uniref:amidohydrolase family protein n=1 Tax=Novosphingobium sp. AP12 TaxID=1144305 RepID=UPI000272000F|nr:amidohydrolase family protein [Novosphingobium sp. AP12]EJL30847.1 Amidohydrolase [Novosphingobium sp. AP12]
MNEETLVPELRAFAGRMLDVDSHEMMPAQAWTAQLGPDFAPLAESFLTNGETNRENINHPNVPDFVADDRDLAEESVWRVKGCSAPGALDVQRRLEVMDAMGVARQLMFPTAGAYGLMTAILPEDNAFGFLEKVRGDRRAIGKACVAAYNQWGIEAAGISDRIRPVLPVLADDVTELMEITRALIASGVRAVWLPSCVPPGGLSPAHYDLDPFWELLAANKIAACLHVGAEGQFFETMAWGDARPFENFRVLGEFRADPWWLSVNHWPTQNFVQSMLVGGVFERHRELVLGVLETGCMWIGPMMEHLDMWHGNMRAFGTAASVVLPEKPSFYAKRNLRIAPFDFEPIGTLIERHPETVDMLCFASDYPHVEGGKDPANRLYHSIAHLGPEVVEKFFVTNGEALLPA